VREVEELLCSLYARHVKWCSVFCTVEGWKKELHIGSAFLDSDVLVWLLYW